MFFSEWQHCVQHLASGSTGAQPELAASVGTCMAQTPKEANSDSIAFLAVIRGYMRVYACICVYMRMRVYVFSVYMCVYACIYMYMRVCACICV